MQRWMRPGCVVAGAFLVLFLATRAPAHGLEFSVETTADRRVRIGAFFEGGSPMAGAAVTVKDNRGSTVYEGRTDDRGFVFFDPPGPDFYAFVIDDGAGDRIKNRFVLQGFQLDGKVRDLFSAGGIPMTWYEKLRSLPRWLTGLLGVGIIAGVFGVLGWIRAAAEVRRLKKEIETLRG